MNEWIVLKIVEHIMGTSLMCRLSMLHTNWCLGDQISATSTNLMKATAGERGAPSIADVRFFALSVFGVSQGRE
jgi:hypothetical protein